MSDPIVNIVRREIERAKNPGGMIAGMPKVTIDAGHAERLCIMADKFEQAEARVAELESVAMDLLNDCINFGFGNTNSILKTASDTLKRKKSSAWLLRQRADALESAANENRLIGQQGEDYVLYEDLATDVQELRQAADEAELNK